MGFLIVFINIFIQVITLLVLAHVILSYFMAPYHPVRQFLDRMIEPLLAPIRRIIPPVGMMDFSPMVLLILVQIVGGILINLLR